MQNFMIKIILKWVKLIESNFASKTDKIKKPDVIKTSGNSKY